MDVYQLRDNLKNTIKNKRELLVDISDDSSDDLVAQFLNINIDELERILVDVEICCEHQPKFVVLIDETNRYTEPDYGPPDPPPQMCYETRARYTAILSEEELEEWIQENLGKKFKIFKIEPIQYKTTIKVDIVK
jgi:hypothetical protein